MGEIQMEFCLKTIVFLFPIWVFSFELCHGRIFTFEMHHWFSKPVKNWSKSTRRLPHLPAEGTFEYYAALAHHDRLFRGRKLADFKGPFAFSGGSSTYRISSLGFLHYTTLQLGAPGVKFMVALDTGSHLSWVPCDCNKCAPTEGVPYAYDFELNVYNPKGSSTSKRVPCISSLCAHRNCCLGTFSSCPCEVSYISVQTATSEILVEDVLHLRTEDSHQESVKAYVTFGYGQVQSGSFLDVAAPNGLFGLGMEKISVPSILSQEGLTADSFSMCSGHDGRISFGDKGSPDQNETPFNLNLPWTSFTYLVDPVYSRLSENFHSQACDKQHPPDSRIPFEYCYDMSMSLTMKGGGLFAIYDPMIFIFTKSQLVYCLAVIKSIEMNIIGQNFMTGYRFVSDREKFVLGWKKFDCFDIEETNNFPVEPYASSLPSAFAAGIGNYTAPQKTRNNSWTSIASQSPQLHASFLSCIRFFFILSLLL